MRQGTESNLIGLMQVLLSFTFSDHGYTMTSIVIGVIGSLNLVIGTVLGIMNRFK